jgi:gas vesicle protein
LIKEKTKMNKEQWGSFGVGILAGAVVGGVVALLFAPKSGKETRKLIKDKTMEVVDTVKEKTGGVIDVFKDGASEINRKGHAAINAIKN